MKKMGLLFLLFSGTVFAESLSVDLESAEVPSVLHQSESVFVITSEMIHRSGYTSLPESLRLAPGVQVSKIQSNQWAVTIRGFNDRFTNKVALFIDGRPVYTPLLGGTVWEAADLMLEDVDHIEVIRGSSGAEYGANGMNGVIRVVTKKAAETPGGFLTGGGGSEEHGFFAARYGGSSGDTQWRYYSKFFNRDRMYNTTVNPDDDWWSSKTGFRMDSLLTDVDELTVSGDYHYANIDQRITFPTSTGSTGTTVVNNETKEQTADLSLNWNHDFSEASSLMTQSSYHFWRRNDPSLLDSYVHVLNLLTEYQFAPLWNQEIALGGRYQLYRDDLTGKGPLSFTDSKVTDHFWSLYLKDDVALVPDQLLLTLSGSLERNEFTGFEHLENARLAWLMSDRNTWWMTGGRSVGTPSRFRDAGQLFVVAESQATNVLVQGSTSLKSENVWAIGTGWRSQLTDNLNVDLSTFYNWYKNIVTQNLSGSTVTFANSAKAKTWGGEASFQYSFTPDWSVSGAYSLLKIGVDNDLTAASYNKLPSAAQGESPQHMMGAWSHMDLPCDFEVDWGGRWVSALNQFSIDNYAVADARVAWLPTEDFTLSVVGQNLFDKNHDEFPSQLFVTGTGISRVEQSIYAKFDWTF